MKSLVVSFAFPVTADELGLYTIPPEVRSWLAEMRSTKIATIGKMTIEPIEPGGLAKRGSARRTRRPAAPPIDIPTNGEATDLLP